MNPSHYLHRTLQDEHPLSLHTNLTLFLLGETSLYMLNQKDYHVSYLFMHDVNRTHRGFGIYFVSFYVQDCLYLGEIGFFREEILEFLGFWVKAIWAFHDDRLATLTLVIPGNIDCLFCFWRASRKIALAAWRLTKPAWGYSRTVE